MLVNLLLLPARFMSFSTIPCIREIKVPYTQRIFIQLFTVGFRKTLTPNAGMLSDDLISSLFCVFRRWFIYESFCVKNHTSDEAKDCSFLSLHARSTANSFPLITVLEIKSFGVLVK